MLTGVVLSAMEIAQGKCCLPVLGDENQMMNGSREKASSSPIRMSGY